MRPDGGDQRLARTRPLLAKDQWHRRESFDVDRTASVCPRVIGRHDDHELVMSDHLAAHPRGGSGCLDETELGVAVAHPFEHGGRVHHLEFDMGLWLGSGSR